MSDATRLYGALGLCMRAGKCVSGDFICEKIIRAGKAKLVLLDETASENTKKRYADFCAMQNLQCIQVADIGQAIGKPGRMVIAVTDERFKNMIIDVTTSAIEKD